MESQSLVNHSAVPHNLRQFSYLFIMDLVRVSVMDYAAYEPREPGFGVPFLEAYIAAFQEPKDFMLSHRLIKNINRLSLRHLPDIVSGEYRTSTGNFKIGLQQYGLRPAPLYAATEDGVDEFISHWFINRKLPTHTLSFELETDPLASSFSVMALERGRLDWATVTNRVRHVTAFDKTKHAPLIKRLLNDQRYHCFINTMAFITEGAPTQRATERLLQAIFDDYHREISEAVSDDDKILIISKHIQHIEQLHPFMDGNVRTCVILLNKLLNDHGLPLSLMLNPNKLDGCHLAEVVHMVKEGQRIYTELLANTNQDEFVIHTAEQLTMLKRLVCRPHDLNEPALLEQFYQTVILNEAIVERHDSGRHRMFGLPRRPSTVVELLTAIDPFLKKNASKQCSAISDAIQRGELSLAFRRACAFGEYKIIKVMLSCRHEALLTINVNERPLASGMTALDRLDACILLDGSLSLKEMTRALLCEAMRFDAEVANEAVAHGSALFDTTA